MHSWVHYESWVLLGSVSNGLSQHGRIHLTAEVAVLAHGCDESGHGFTDFTGGGHDEAGAALCEALVHAGGQSGHRQQLMGCAQDENGLAVAELVLDELQRMRVLREGRNRLG